MFLRSVSAYFYWPIVSLCYINCSVWQKVTKYTFEVFVPYSNIFFWWHNYIVLLNLLFHTQHMTICNRLQQLPDGLIILYNYIYYINILTKVKSIFMVLFSVIWISCNQLIGHNSHGEGVTFADFLNVTKHISHWANVLLVNQSQRWWGLRLSVLSMICNGECGSEASMTTSWCEHNCAQQVEEKHHRNQKYLCRD